MFLQYWDSDVEKVEVAKRLLELTHGVYFDNGDITPLAAQSMALDAMKAIYQRSEFVTVLELEQCITDAWAEMNRTALV